MKITKSTLQRIIQEEVQAVLREGAIPLDVKRTKVYQPRGQEFDPRFNPKGETKKGWEWSHQNLPGEEGGGPNLMPRDTTQAFGSYGQTREFPKGNVDIDKSRLYGDAEGHVAAAKTKLKKSKAAAADLLNEPLSDEEKAAMQESHLQQIVQEELAALLRENDPPTIGLGGADISNQPPVPPVSTDTDGPVAEEIPVTSLEDLEDKAYTAEELLKHGIDVKNTPIKLNTKHPGRHWQRVKTRNADGAEGAAWVLNLKGKKMRNALIDIRDFDQEADAQRRTKTHAGEVRGGRRGLDTDPRR